MRKLFFLLITIFLAACESTQDYKMGYSGAPNEIVAVTSQAQWAGSIGSTIQEYFTEHETVLPQAERKFWIINIDEENFGSLFQTHRNVLLIDIKKDAESKIEFQKSKWAKDQLVTLQTN